MVVFALWIINKTGGLIFEKEFATGRLPTLSTNAFLKLASVFHAQNAIAQQLAPVCVNECSGIQCLEADGFKLFCHETVTALKFVLITDPSCTSAQIDPLLQSIYELYADYVLKNPFYEVEQPIRVSRWEAKLKEKVEELDVVEQGFDVERERGT
eukprot:NODE_6293_length_552_cov_13.303529_g6128_i0.p1 GENE.NODE_6293_length_552_cov_13.303529_g6128_i0~~NODE_6293_length_552_cov_13.303529_g6128_i0.p1  ORF type:complete len:164 (-),score=62.00 NODE_6293_length_552_cov_13.303529_g6128_i0:59-523(-)